MRIASLFVVILASVGCGSGNGVGTGDAPYRPTYSVREVMQSVVAPNAEGLWNAVGRISNAQGTVDLEPKTDADWELVRRRAIALIESTNLLLIPGRHVAPPGATTLHVDEAEPGATLTPAEIEERIAASWPQWVSLAHGLHDTATTVLRAIDRKDVAGLETTGSELDVACENCHMTFWYPPRSANSK